MHWYTNSKKVADKIACYNKLTCFSEKDSYAQVHRDSTITPAYKNKTKKVDLPSLKNRCHDPKQIA